MRRVWLENLPQFQKLLLSFALIVLLMIGICVMLYQAMLSRVTAQILLANRTVHERVQERLESRLFELDNQMLELKRNPALLKVLGRKLNVSGKDLFELMDVQDTLPNYTLGNEDTAGYYIYATLDGWLLSPDTIALRMPLYYDTLYRFGDYTYDEWDALMRSERQSGRLYPAQKVTLSGKTQRCIPYLCAIRSQGGTRTVGQIAVFLDEGNILTLLNRSFDNEALYAGLFDAEGRLITHSGNTALLDAWNALSEGSDGQYAVLDGIHTVVLSTTSARGFSCLSILSYDAIASGLSGIRVVMTLVVLGMLAVGGVASLALARSNTRQLRRIMGQLQSEEQSLDRQNELVRIDHALTELYTHRDQMRMRLEQRRRWMHSALFEKLLDGRAVEPELLAELEDAHDFVACHCVILLARRDAQGLDTHFDWTEHVRGLLGQQTERVPYFRFLDENRVQAVFLLRNDNDASNCTFFWETFAESTQTNTGVDTLVLVGPAAEDFSELALSGNAALRECMLADWYEGQKVVRCTVRKEPSLTPWYSMENEKRIMENCMQGNTDEALRELDMLRAGIQRDGIQSQLTVQVFTANLIGTLMKIMASLPGIQDTALETEITREAGQSMRDPSVRQTFDFASRCVTRFCACALHAQTENSRRRIAEIQAYIRERYADAELGLYSVSKAFGLTERSLSEFYKRHTGVNFSTYVEQVRMQAARERLQQGEAVGVTAERTGYLNVNTFRRAYKRCYGVTPMDGKRNP